MNKLQWNQKNNREKSVKQRARSLQKNNKINIPLPRLTPSSQSTKRKKKVRHKLPISGIKQGYQLSLQNPLKLKE